MDTLTFKQLENEDIIKQFSQSDIDNESTYSKHMNDEGLLKFNQTLSRRSCVHSKVRWLMFRQIKPQLKTEEHILAAQWILCHCHKQLPYDRNWWSRIERQQGELSLDHPEVERQINKLNITLNSFSQQLVRATSAVRKYIDGIDPITNTLRKRDWNASTSLSEWISGDRGLLIKKLANNDPDVRHIKPYLPDCLCESNLKEALHNGGILIYTEQFPSCQRIKKRMSLESTDNEVALLQINSLLPSITKQDYTVPLNLVRPGAADTRMLDITLMDGAVLPVRRSRCSLGIPPAFVSDPVVIPKICVYDFSNGLHLYIFYRGHKMGKRKRPRFYVAELHHLIHQTPTSQLNSNQMISPSSPYNTDSNFESNRNSFISSSHSIQAETTENQQNDVTVWNHEKDDKEESPQEKRPRKLMPNPSGFIQNPEHIIHQSTQSITSSSSSSSSLLDVCGLPSDVLIQLLPGFSPPDVINPLNNTHTLINNVISTQNDETKHIGMNKEINCSTTRYITPVPHSNRLSESRISGVSAIHRNLESARRPSTIHSPLDNKQQRLSLPHIIEDQSVSHRLQQSIVSSTKIANKPQILMKAEQESSIHLNSKENEIKNDLSHNHCVVQRVESNYLKSGIQCPSVVSTPDIQLHQNNCKSIIKSKVLAAETAIPVQTVFVGADSSTYLFNANLVLKIAAPTILSSIMPTPISNSLLEPHTHLKKQNCVHNRQCHHQPPCNHLHRGIPKTIIDSESTEQPKKTTEITEISVNEKNSSILVPEIPDDNDKDDSQSETSSDNHRIDPLSVLSATTTTTSTSASTVIDGKSLVDVGNGIHQLFPLSLEEKQLNIDSQPTDTLCTNSEDANDLTHGQDVSNLSIIHHTPNPETLYQNYNNVSGHLNITEVPLSSVNAKLTNVTILMMHSE